MAACSGLCKSQLRSIELVTTATGEPSVTVTQGGGDFLAGTAPDTVEAAAPLVPTTGAAQDSTASL